MIEIIKTKNRQYSFRVRAKNGKILCHSETYRTKRGCVNGIGALQDVLESCYGSEIKDLTKK